MRIRNLIAATLLFHLPAAMAALPSDAPLVEDGPTKVTAVDIEGYILRVPERMRGEAMASYDRVANMVDAVYLNRVFARKAKEMGLDRSPAVQARLMHLQELYLAELFFQEFDKSAKIPDLEPRARELYKAEPAKYMGAEQVHVQHLLVSFHKRTPEMALERARQARAEAVAAGTREGFLAVSARFNDDPDRQRHGGDLGLMGAKSFVEPVAKAIEGLKTRGQVSEVIESDQGYHIVRFEERRPAEMAPFTAVRAQLIETEAARMLKERRIEQVNDVRASTTVVVHRANVEALVSTADIAAAAARAMERKPK